MDDSEKDSKIDSLTSLLAHLPTGSTAVPYTTADPGATENRPFSPPVSGAVDVLDVDPPTGESVLLSSGSSDTPVFPSPDAGVSPLYLQEYQTTRRGNSPQSSTNPQSTVASNGAATPGDPSAYQQGDEELVPGEIVVEKNGQPRQAGSDVNEGEYTKRYKVRAEQSLFIFLKGVLGRFFLTPHFHRKICQFIQRIPPYRKLVMMPREHAKTTIVAGGLPPHILIQPAETNIYFLGMEGSECRILLCGETETMAKKNLRVVQAVFEENRLFRAFWPGRVWQGRAKSEARQWSDSAIIIPRENEWPDPTIRAVGVGGAITGARPNVLLKDDLVSFKAANSDVVMDEAIEWHKASRALLDKYTIESGLHSLEWLIGTRWAVYDLYSEIIDNDPSVEVNDEKYHRIINDGKILWPEKYSLEDIEQLRREHGSNFYLLYLNSAADPELTDFDMRLVRRFLITNGMIQFDEDERDILLMKRAEGRKERSVNGPPPIEASPGKRLNDLIQERLKQGKGVQWGMRVRRD